MSEIKQVVTYSTPLPGREIALCDEHARTQKTWALGAVQHGAHDGVCEMCRRSEAAAILGRDSAARAGRAGRGAAKRRGDSKHYQELAARRMRLTVEDSGHVEITYRDAVTDETVTRRFSAGSTDDRHVYVVEHLAGGRMAQVCEQLAGTGTTLRASRSTLAGVIRREYRAMREAERREYDRR